MSNDLRKKLIRLAHENPELRKDLLPLLKEGRTAHEKQGADWIPWDKSLQEGAELEGLWTIMRQMQQMDRLMVPCVTQGLQISAQAGLLSEVYSPTYLGEAWHSERLWKGEEKWAESFTDRLSSLGRELRQRLKSLEKTTKKRI